MLHTLEKGEYPKGHRYWSNATGDLNAALEDLPVQLRRVLDELWSDGYGVECYLVEWNGRYCVQLSAMYDRDYAEDLGMGYPELVELADAQTAAEISKKDLGCRHGRFSPFG